MRLLLLFFFDHEPDFVNRRRHRFHLYLRTGYCAWYRHCACGIHSIVLSSINIPEQDAGVADIAEKHSELADI